MELCDPPRYDGLNEISYFVQAFEFYILEQQILLALDVVLKATLARWWVAHKEGIKYWQECRRLMQVRFGTEVEYIVHKYIGVSDPVDHIVQFRNI
jgi:hypothetical protein